MFLYSKEGKQVKILKQQIMKEGLKKMTLLEQKQLLKLINKYKQIDITIIKNNIKKYIDQSEYYWNSKKLAEVLNQDIQTIYLWRQPKKKFNIDFLTALRIADCLNITIDKFLE